MGVKVQDKMWQQHFALHQKVSWIASQLSTKLHAFTPLYPKEGAQLPTSSLTELVSPYNAYNPILPPVLQGSQHYQETWTAEESSSSSWVKVFLLHQSSPILLQFIAAVHSFSNSFPCCAKCFSKKYISNVLQEVTVKNYPRKQKQMKKLTLKRNQGHQGVDALN